MNKKIIKRIFLTLIIIAGASVYFHAQQSYSANLTNVTVTLSNSRPSFKGVLASGNAAGTSSVTINTTSGIAPSISTDQLVQGSAPGEQVLIGNSDSLATYSVTEVVDGDTFSVSPVLQAGDADAGDDVIATSSADLTAEFTTATAVNNGAFRLLVPAATDNADSADGIPDAGYFDYTAAGPSVNCPGDTTNYTFGTEAAAASNVTVDGVDYHAFTCPYTGSGAIGTSFSNMTVTSLINPAPPSGHTTGTADRYTLIMQHLDDGPLNDGNNREVVDQTAVSVGTIEAVRVTAEVAPIITFEIGAVSSGQSACGNTTSVTTTAATVPFGELLISSFKHAAQSMTVSTNASGGYAVTAKANDQLGRNGQTCAGSPTSDPDCIPDSLGDDTTMTHSNEDEWSSTAVKGFAYSLDDYDSTGETPVFEYDSTSNDCDGSGDCFRHFADAQDSQNAVQIFSSSAPADGHSIYACYKAVISSTQSAGNYENYITYTATATF